MLSPLTNLGNSSRLLLAAGGLVLALSVASVAAFATGSLGSGERAAPRHRAALQDKRDARHQVGISRRVRVSGAVPDGTGGTGAPAPAPAEPSAPVAIPVAKKPGTAPSAQPSPAPEPSPTLSEPEPAPSPAPEPPPSASQPSQPSLEPAPSPAPDPAPAPQPAGEILFAANFDEDGFSGWYVQSTPGRASISPNSYEGPSAARFEVRAGDVEPDTGSQRSEISGPTFNQGEDLYIRDVIRVPSSNAYTAPWQIIQQLHEEDWGGSPGMAVFLEPAPSLRIGAGDGSPVFWKSGQLQADRWYDLVYRVNLSQDPNTGFVEVWLDGAQQTLVNGETRIYGQTIQTARTYLKAGIYRAKSSTGTSIVEHDNIVVGTSLAAVNGF